MVKWGKIDDNTLWELALANHSMILWNLRVGKREALRIWIINPLNL